MKFFKFISLLIFISICSISCNNQTNFDTVKSYYEARNEVDFKSMKVVLYDQIIEIEGTDTMPYSTTDYYKKFQWDSVFSPKYKIISIKEVDKNIIATISVQSKRFDFLLNAPLVSIHKFSFTNNEINVMETLDYIDTDWTMWQNNLDTLKKWVKIYQPDLEGFANDMTKQGAEKYLNAIQLFRK